MGLLAWSQYSPEAGDILEQIRAQRVVLVVLDGPAGNGVAVAGAEESAMPHAPEDLDCLGAFVRGALYRAGLDMGLVALEFKGVQAIPPEATITDTPTNLAAGLLHDLDALLVALTWRDRTGRGFQVAAAAPEPILQLPVHLENVATMARAKGGAGLN